MNVNVKKTFEFLLMVIVFYGVYSGISTAAPVVVSNPNEIWLVLGSLVISALLLWLYSMMIKKTSRAQDKKSIHHLRKERDEKDKRIAELETTTAANKPITEETSVKDNTTNPQL